MEKKKNVDAFVEQTLLEYKDNPTVQRLLEDEDFRNAVKDYGLSGVVDGDYVLPKDQWGKSQEERKKSGIHGTDGGEVGGTPYGKLPNHPTFSNESPFSAGEQQGGTWKSGESSTAFTPSEWMMRDKKRMKELKRYWDKAEKGNILNMSSPKIVPDDTMKNRTIPENAGIGNIIQNRLY